MFLSFGMPLMTCVKAAGACCDAIAHVPEKPYLEDHPMTCKWLITMVIVFPRPGVVGPLPNGRTSWLINGGDTNYLQVLG